MQGFLVLNCIIGGQTLASVSPHLNDTLGIVIISVIALAVCHVRLHPFIQCAECFAGDLLWLSIPSLVKTTTLASSRWLKLVHRYESIAWLPNVVAFIVMLAVGYPQLHANQSVVVPAATPRSILSFASTVASSITSWCSMTPDYGVYHSPSASS